MLRRTLIVFIPLAMVTAAVFYVLFDLRISAVSSIWQAQDRQIVKTGSDLLANAIRPIVSDVRYLSQQRVLSRWLDTGDATDRTELSRSHLTFISSKSEYDQIRFIDESGLEVARSDRRDGETIVVPVAELQNKASRYYVRAILKSSRGEIYASPFDLNVENGVVETPINPVIRIGTPVFDAKGRKRGLVVMNYRGQGLLERLRSLDADYRGDVWLLNGDGYWLRGPKGREWAFMYPDRRHLTLARTNPDVWTRLSAGSASGQFLSAGNRFTYARISPYANPLGAADVRVTQGTRSSQIWYLVVRVPSTLIAAENWKTSRVFIYVGAAALILLLAVSVKAGQVWARRNAAEAEIKVLNDRLVSDNIQLEAINRELEAFNYSVSHDLRAPLRAIDGFSQALAEDHGEKLDNDSQVSLDRIRKAAQRMGELIDDLLDLSRISRSDMTPVRVDLSKIARTVIDELRASDPARQVDVSITPKLIAKGDPRLLRVALENLLGNAWKFTMKCSPARIEFGQRQTAGETAYYVKDNGVGFDLAHGGKIFHAFQRLHDRRDFPGTGIGLAIVQRVLNKHGGRIWAESAPDQGATFYFVL